MTPIPTWLSFVSLVSLACSCGCAGIILIDILAGRRQKMWIMNVVWPVTALYSGFLGLWAYFKVGRPAGPTRSGRGDAGASLTGKKPFWVSVALAATHCGAGCTLGDIIAEFLLVLYPATLFGRPLFAAWVLDFLFAFLIGIAFQYFTIQPMRHLSVRRGIAAAVKADALSLTSWQIGMYGWMAISVFLIFGHELEKTGPVFWFMMQIAMLAGFITAYPVNWWLLRSGIKEPM